MRTVLGGLSRRTPPCGGVVSYLSERIYREVAYIAYHFNWPKDEIMSMSHYERQRWIREISAINKQINTNIVKAFGESEKRND